MLGQAALAMWWEMAPALREEFEHWHSHEHFPERLGLPGFLRGSRWADAQGGPGFFVIYELARHDSLVSPEYLARLNAPTEWSRRMMPHHRGMVRCQCRVIASRGSAVSGHALTVRLSPAKGAEAALREHLGALVNELPGQPGLLGAHLLQTDTPDIAATTEQHIRGLADRSADWVLLVTGYDAAAVRRLGEATLSAAALQAQGAADGVLPALHVLGASMTAGEAPR